MFFLIFFFWPILPQSWGKSGIADRIYPHHQKILTAHSKGLTFNAEVDTILGLLTE